MSAPTAAPPGTDSPRTDWSELDARTVNVIRALAMDAVEEAGSGHPGTAMSLAPAAWVLFQRLLRHDPTDPTWVGRDRFVLSVGHSSLTLYVQLYLSGYGLTLEDLKRLRQLNSLTPAHPEVGHTVGVETTTGPLGQGVGNAVGMAMAARRRRALLDPDAEPGQSVFDHTVWCFASDGDLQEGVSAESSSLAGHQALGNLVLLYDDNNISIEGDTGVAFSEDVLARYRAYGWHTQRVEDSEDAPAVQAALEAGRAETERPSIIAMRSVIAYPAPNAQNTGAAHGSALGAEEVAATKEVMGMDPSATFVVPQDVLDGAREVVDRGRALHEAWRADFDRWEKGNPAGAQLLARLEERRLPEGWAQEMPTFEAGDSVATRKAGGAVLNAVAPALPELFGGSADLAGSNSTEIKGEGSFLPEGNPLGSPSGRNMHFGIREHAMGSTMNGMALYGLRPYGGTFLVFSDYMRPAVRLACLMRLPVTYVWTHDSIGLGEDGGTHQPVEHLMALRAIPRLSVVRPADATETVVAWRTVLEKAGPAGLALTRQNVPVLDRSELASAEGVARGGYVLAEASSGIPRVLLIATGSEVSIALAARERLEEEGTPTRVVSMPCWEWFEAQDEAYRQEVLPGAVSARISVEAGISMGWERWVGPHGVSLGVEDFGDSAPYQQVYEKFGLTPDRVVAAAHDSLSRAGAGSGSTTGN